jgi:hypothetical protein
MSELWREAKDYGGIEVADDRDDAPIHFPSAAAITTEAIDAVIAARQLRRTTEAKLARIDDAVSDLHTKIASLQDDARQYVLTHPAVTLAQLRTAFIASLKTYVGGLS